MELPEIVRILRNVVMRFLDQRRKVPVPVHDPDKRMSEEVIASAVDGFHGHDALHPYILPEIIGMVQVNSLEVPQYQIVTPFPPVPEAPLTIMDRFFPVDAELEVDLVLQEKLQDFVGHDRP